MKRGAGDDPFADDDTEKQGAAPSPQDLSQSDRADTNGDEQNGSTIKERQPAGSRESVVSTTANDGPAVVEYTHDDNGDPALDAKASTTTMSASQSVDALPYLAKRQLRGESVKADRHQVPFFLRDEVQRGEKALQRAVEDGLQQDVNKTDLREAAYVFAQQHPEGVAAILREWGIEYLD